MQHGTKLYVINLEKIGRELFYQIVIRRFGELPTIDIEPPPSIRDLALIALDNPENGWSPEDGPKDGLAVHVSEFLAEKSDMLKEYFSLKIEDGALKTLPLLLSDHKPVMQGFGDFILRLATQVDWNS